MKLGEWQNLSIEKIVSFGAYLIDDDGNKVLLPKKQIPKGAKINDQISVYIYNDSNDRIIATTHKVFLSVGEAAELTVTDINKMGAFLNIGIEKDLLLPHSEQTKDIKVGDKIKVYMYIDKSNRLAATMYLNNKDIKSKVKNSTIRTYEYEQNAEKIYKIIKNRFKGHLIYNDKNCSTEQVKNDFNVSKNTFKKSIGKLYKDKKLKISDKGIFLY